MTIITILTYLMFIKACSSISSEGKCIESISNGETKWHCCDNKEEKYGICVDCFDGFVSEAGESCHPCIEGMYGRKCADRCDCEVYQWCDNIQGCVNYTSHVIVSAMLSESSTYWNSLDSTPAYDPGIFRTEFIYSMCIIILIVVVICMIWFQRLKRKRLSRDVHETDHGNKVSQNKVPEVKDDTVANQFGVYDNIDYSPIWDIMIQEVNSVVISETAYHDSGNSKLDSEETTISLNDGYLNPYQHVLSSNESHGCTEATDSVDHLLTFRSKTTADIEVTRNAIIEELPSSSDPTNRDAISERSNEDGQMSNYMSTQEIQTSFE